MKRASKLLLYGLLYSCVMGVAARYLAPQEFLPVFTISFAIISILLLVQIYQERLRISRNTSSLASQARGLFQQRYGYDFLELDPETGLALWALRNSVAKILHKRLLDEGRCLLLPLKDSTEIFLDRRPQIIYDILEEMKRQQGEGTIEEEFFDRGEEPCPIPT